MDNPRESRVSAMWKRISRSVSGIFKSAPETILAKEQTPETESLYHSIEEKFDEIKKTPAFQIKETEEIVNTLMVTMNEWRIFFWKFGRWNGVLGSISIEEADKLATSHAQSLGIQLKTEVLGVRDALDKEVVLAEAKIKEERQGYDEEKTYVAYLDSQRRYNSNLFSPTLAWLYVVIGFVLFLSDIPLALQLITSGFNLLTSRKYPLSNLFFDPLNVFVYNWMAFFTAFGIAFITVYIKMYYDEYVGMAEGANSIRKNILGKMIEPHGVMDQKEKQIKFWVKTVTLVLVIAMLVVLAIFRSESAKRIDPNFNAGFTSQAVFFFMTLMLPIVSGICLSISLKTFQNIRNRKKAIAWLEKVKGILNGMTLQRDNSIKKYNVVKSLYQEWLNNDEFYAFAKNYFLSYYKLGYEQGYLEPDSIDKETDFMRRIEILRNKTLARNTLKRLSEVKL